MEKSSANALTLLHANYEFCLFGALILYSFFTGDIFAAELLAGGLILWLAMCKFIPEKKREANEKETALVKKFSSYKNYAYYALVACFVLFLLLKANAMFSLLFLLLIGLLMVFIVASESVAGFFSGGLKNEAREVVLAILWALCIWFALGMLLGSKVPFNGVVSCSMVPSLERGDLLVLRGESAQGATGIVTLKQGELESIGNLALVNYKGESHSFNGSIFSYCVAHNTESICKDFSTKPSAFEEFHGPIRFTYDYCERVTLSGKPLQREICVAQISYNGKVLEPTNDVAVYEPNKGDFFSYSGDIVHRIVARLQYGNSTKYIIKGDNNPVADMQVYDYKHGIGNTPVGSERVKGIVLFKVPYVGFFKLAISSPLNPALAIAIENCDSKYA